MCFNLNTVITVKVELLKMLLVGFLMLPECHIFYFIVAFFVVSLCLCVCRGALEKLGVVSWSELMSLLHKCSAFGSVSSKPCSLTDYFFDQTWCMLPKKHLYFLSLSCFYCFMEGKLFLPPLPTYQCEKGFSWRRTMSCLMWPECVGRSWVMKPLMPFSGPLVPLT